MLKSLWQKWWTVNSKGGGEEIEDLVKLLKERRNELLLVQNELQRNYQLSDERNTRIAKDTQANLDSLDDWLEQLALATLHQVTVDIYSEAVQRLGKFEMLCSDDQVRLTEFIAVNHENRETHERQRTIRKLMQPPAEEEEQQILIAPSGSNSHKKKTHRHIKQQAQPPFAG